MGRRINKIACIERDRENGIERARENRCKKIYTTRESESKEK